MIHIGWAAAKNAAATAVVYIPVGAALGFTPNDFMASIVTLVPAGFSSDALFWGGMGGICRTLAALLTKAAPATGKHIWASGHIVLGALCATGLSSLKLPFVQEMMTDAPNIQPFIIGLVSITIIGLFQDLADAYRKARGGNAP